MATNLRFTPKICNLARSGDQQLLEPLTDSLAGALALIARLVRQQVTRGALQRAAPRNVGSLRGTFKQIDAVSKASVVRSNV